MVVLKEQVKLIAKTPQGSVFISYCALQDHITDVVKNLISTNKYPYILKDVEFTKFEDDIDFQIDVYCDVKDGKDISHEINSDIQQAILNLLGVEYQIEVLSINVVCGLKSK